MISLINHHFEQKKNRKQKTKSTTNQLCKNTIRRSKTNSVKLVKCVQTKCGEH